MTHNSPVNKAIFLLILSGYMLYSSAYAQPNPDTEAPIQFTMQQIASESYESAGVFDVNGDGNLDIISGSYWYEGPGFLRRHKTRDIERHGEYWDEFATIPMDVNGNGRIDFITGGWFSKQIIWLENPGNNGEWPEHIIDETGNVEAIGAWDIDNDGHLEIVPNNPNDPLKFYKLDRDSDGVAQGTFTKVAVADGQGHGIGFGDISGNGRGDFIVSNGWLESPRDMEKGTWTIHNDFDFGSASIPILVTDVNGNGINDLIVGQAHGFGLDWYEQTRNSSEDRTWIKHPMDLDNSQFHTMKLVDLDGDGENELITGKRYRAHNDGDPGADDPIGLYFFKWNGESFDKHTIAYGPLGEGKGTGIQFSVADLRGTGRMDIIVAGKDGLYVLYNDGTSNN